MMEDDSQPTLPCESPLNLKASDVEACRICLTTDDKLHSLQGTHLGTCMESIGGLTNPCGGLPNYVCYECAPILLKCNKLIEKNKKAHAALLDIFEKNGKITQSLIKDQNRSQLNLKSPLDSYLLINYFYIKYDDENNTSEFIPTASYANLKIETKMEDELEIESADDSSENEEVDDSLEEIKENVSVLELSDDEINKEFINLSSDEEDAENRKKRKLDQEIPRIEVSRSQKKKAAKRKRCDTKEGLRTSDTVPVKFQLELRELQHHFNIVEKTPEEQVAEWRQKQTGMGLTCSICLKLFSNAELLLAHSYHHVASIHGHIKCDICLVCFQTVEAMQNHSLSVHANKFCCKFCPAEFDELDDAKAHLKQAQIQPIEEETPPPGSQSQRNWYPREEDWLNKIKPRGIEGVRELFLSRWNVPQWVKQGETD